MIKRSRSLLWTVGIPVLFAEAIVLMAIITFLRPQNQTNDSDSGALVLIACGVVALLSTFAALWITSRFLKRQADELAAAASRFGAGDFSTRLLPPTADELATLALALDKMSYQLNSRIGELQLQQRQQRAILQSMSNAVLAVDTEQRFLMVNRAAIDLLGLHADDIHGRLLQEVIRQPELHGFVRQALADPSPHHVELQFMGDSPMTVQAISGPLTTTDGTAGGLLIVLNDVSELRRLETLRNEFAANVSHELRTPITNLKGYVETLLEVGTADEQQSRRFLTIIQHNVERLAAIVDDVMALTEVERTREQLQRTDTPVADLVNTVIEQFTPSAAAKNITLKSVCSSDLRVFVQPRLIEQAVGNLVANAITYSPCDTTVTIESAALETGEVEIAVVDEGPGIAREHLPRLFERFYRIDQARSRAVGGTGLGLAIVKHIALSNGGRVEVSSDPGHGSRFVIILPTA